MKSRSTAPDRGVSNREKRSGSWWARQDSNLQPDRYERSALTIELQARSAPAGAERQRLGAAGGVMPWRRHRIKGFGAFARRFPADAGTPRRSNLPSCLADAAVFQNLHGAGGASFRRSSALRASAFPAYARAAGASAGMLHCPPSAAPPQRRRHDNVDANRIRICATPWRTHASSRA